MVLPERNNFIEEIEYINSKDIKDKLILLYDYVKGIGKKDIDTYKILKDVLDKLFNPNLLAKYWNKCYTIFSKLFNNI